MSAKSTPKSAPPPSASALAAMSALLDTAGDPGEFTLVAGPGRTTILMTRMFPAPRALVFEVSTRPEHVRRWWGPAGTTLTVCEADVRPGGTWHYVLRGADGSEHPFRGEYREVIPPERLVHTFIYDVDGFREREAQVTVTFTEHQGRTRLVSTTVHKTVEHRDGHFQAGHQGMRETSDRLADLLARLA